jgi:hypothetical protein
VKHPELRGEVKSYLSGSFPLVRWKHYLNHALAQMAFMIELVSFMCVGGSRMTAFYAKVHRLTSCCFQIRQAVRMHVYPQPSLLLLKHSLSLSSHLQVGLEEGDGFLREVPNLVRTNRRNLLSHC